MMNLVGWNLLFIFGGFNSGESNRAARSSSDESHVFQRRVPNNKPCISRGYMLRGQSHLTSSDEVSEVIVESSRWPAIVNRLLGPTIVGAHLLFPVWALDTQCQFQCYFYQKKRKKRKYLRPNPPSHTFTQILIMFSFLILLEVLNIYSIYYIAVVQY